MLSALLNKEVIFSFKTSFYAAKKSTEQCCHQESSLTDERIIQFKLMIYWEYEIDLKNECI